MTRKLALVAMLVANLPLGACRSEHAGVVSIETDPAYQDPALLERAWALPVASRYRDRFQFQENGSLCGPTSVVNALQSLGLDAGSQQDLLDRRDLGLFGFLPGGLTLDELAGVLRAEQPHPVHAQRDLDLAAFRALVRTANDPGRRLIANFHRGPLFGRGGGHHSPLGGYLEDQDLVLVLDVNEEYRPFLVRTDRLFAAVDTVDGMADRKRGLLVLERGSAPTVQEAP